MPKRLVFIDIDGTLVNHDQEVPSSAQAALATAVAAGHSLILCTGRGKVEIYPWLWKLGFHGLVANNGAYGEIDGATIFNDHIPENDVTEIAAWFDEYGTPCMWTTPEALYLVRGYMHFYEAPDGTGDAPVTGDWTTYLRQVEPYVRTDVPRTANKLTFFLPRGSRMRLDDVREHFGRRFAIAAGSMPHDQGEAGELTAMGMNKSVGVRKMAAYLACPQCDTIGLGDSGNDIEMLRSVGVGVAMGNGITEAKSAADWVTASIDNDGLALAFERLGLAKS